MQTHHIPPPEPGDVPRLAAAIVEAADDISGATLDYGPDSLLAVEEIIDGFRAEGVNGAEMAESLVAFGCYVGEVLTRHFGGVWRPAPADGGAAASPVVELPDGREYDPIAWVFRRLEPAGPEAGGADDGGEPWHVVSPATE
ncbi:hypothetical protein [Streptomyces sp. NPDC046988]|uniref:hypothetical protein n=1 Tax=Streptomyces sp. NPDC046988 TaxID=3154922 RepID=UPI0033D01C0E